jgi:PleD family two-component response regulator
MQTVNLTLSHRVWRSLSNLKKSWRNMSNILIIDDEKAIRKTLSEILSYEGYKID